MHLWISIELGDLHHDTLQKYINEGKTGIVKEYLQVIEKYFECTSEILHKFGRLNYVQREEDKVIVQKKLKSLYAI